MSILERVEKHARKEFKRNTWKEFPYHNLTHTESVVSLCKEITASMNLKKRDVELLLIAAWFHDLGYSKSYANHEDASKKMAKKYLQKEGYDSSGIKAIMKLIDSTRVDHTSYRGKLEKIMFDADRGSIGQPNFYELGNLLRKEWETHQFALFSDDGWNALQVRYLENTQFKTDYSRMKYGPQRLKNLEEARKKL